MIPLPPDQQLAEGFARHARSWALAQGCDPAVAALVHRAAAALSLAVSGGHVCLALADLAGDDSPDLGPDLGPDRAPDVAAWRAALRASGIVGTPQAPGAMPLVLDDQDRLYLHRYADYERRLAARLVEAAQAPADAAAASPAIRAQLAALFASEARAGGRADWQQLAAALALRGRLTVISGGPGTGKTTTVVNLLACLLALDPHCRIALAAPTGKAAARMTDAIRQRAAHLPEALRAALPAEASTVHRLLGVKASGSGFVHDAAHPLAIDALVVDEASMLDLALATQLLEAVPASARLILLGDKDQLAAVESGAVFAELSVDPTLSDAAVADLAAMTATPPAAIRPPSPATPSALRDASVWFTRNYRFATDSGIGRLARDVNRGAAAEAISWLRAGTDPTLDWLEDAPGARAARALPAEALRRMDEGYAAYVECVAGNPTRHADITAAFNHFRVLCAMREGPRGVVALNAEMTTRLRAALHLPGLDEGPARSPWFPGRPVMVLNNDYVLKLFNGDIGIALPDAHGELRVHFPDAAAEGGFRAIAPVRMPRHETAFAMTVHKSQGSEFDAVFVVLPDQRSRVLTRELLYTAITRARRRVALLAGEAVLAAAIDAPTRRRSGLLTRIAERAAAAAG